MTGEEFEPKLIYLARRNPTLTRAQFVTRWRRHGALGMSMPRWKNIARYVHSDVLETDPDASGLSVGYDGVGLIWHRSPRARAAHLADTGSRTEMERDEFDTFAEPVVNVCLLAREEVLVAPGTGTASAKLMRFSATQDTADPDSYGASAVRTGLSGIGCTVHGHVLNRALPPERNDRWGLASGLIEEFWFENAQEAATAAAWLASASGAARGGGDPAAWGVTVLTNSVLLYAA